MNTNTAVANTRGTEFFVPNFVGTNPLEIQAATTQDAHHNPLVHITQSCGSSTFQHTLTFDQCHIMAAALIKAAAESHEMFQRAKAEKPTIRAMRIVDGVRSWVDLPADTAPAKTSAAAPALA